MNRVEVLMLALSVAAVAAVAAVGAGCSSMGKQKQVATGTYFERKPASEAKAPLQEGTQIRVLKNMRLEAIDYKGAHGVYLSDGRQLKLAEVREFNTSSTPKITQYCILYTEPKTRKFVLREGDLLKLEPVPKEAYWAPGHIYETSGATAVKGIGCFMLTNNPANDINEKLFRDQLGGILEIVQ